MLSTRHMEYNIETCLVTVSSIVTFRCRQSQEPLVANQGTGTDTRIHAWGYAGNLT